MAKLYELTGAVLKLHEKLEELENIDQQTIIDSFESSQEYMDFEEKAVAVARFIKNVEGDIPAIDKEIDRLRAMKTAKENAVQHMKTYLQVQMETSGVTKIKRDMFNVGIQDNAPSLIIENEKLVPVGYTRFEQQRVIDKAIIKEFLKSGKSVPGCRLYVGKSLRIR